MAFVLRTEGARVMVGAGRAARIVVEGSELSAEEAGLLRKLGHEVEDTAEEGMDAAELEELLAGNPKKGELEGAIVRLGGNPSDFSTNGERVAFLASLLEDASEE